jgi:hypothetical protein
MAAVLLLMVAFAAGWVEIELPQHSGVALHRVSEATVSCPEQDFSSFLRRFADDVEFQSESTKYPFTSSWNIDATAEPEPLIGTKTYNRGEVKFPIMPLRPERSRLMLEMFVESETATKAVAVMRASDGDYFAVVYYFEKDDCWRLVREVDYSL